MAILKFSLIRTATVTVTAGTLDAIPLPTDHGELLPLPTGDVSVPAATLQDESSNCIVKAPDVLTWQCTTNGMFTFRIDQDEDDEKAMISFDSYNVSGQFYYGAQPPIFRESDHPLELMLDKTNKSLGPAYFFFTSIDKLVIIPEDDFPYGVSKRGVDESHVWKRWSGLYTRVSSSVGDKPWFCWWNNTLIEAFIYVNENSSVATSTFSAPHTLRSRTFSTADPYPSERTTEERGDITLPAHNFYPRAIKIEEKRYWSHGNPTYCEQMQVLENGMVNRLAPDKQISIDEAFTFTDAGTAVNGEKNLAKQGEFHDIGCFCQYFYS